MKLEDAMRFAKYDKNGTKSLRRDLENRYRVSIKRIQFEDSGVVTIYNPDEKAEKRIVKEGWILKNHLGIISKEEA